MRPADAARRRRLRIVRRGQHVLYRRAADGDLPHPDATASAAAACSRTSRRAARSAGTARRRAASARKFSSTRSPSASTIDPADLRLRIVAQPDTLTANYLRVGTIGLAECIRRVVAALGLDRDSSGKLPHGRGVGLACSSYLSGAGLPIYWNDLPHSGVQLKLDRSGGVTAFCGATEIGQGSDDVLVGVRGGGARHRSVRHSRGHRRHRSDAGRSRLLFEPRHADDGQRRDPGGRARARSARRRGRRASSSVPTDRLVVRRPPRVRRRATRTHGVTFQEAVCIAEALFGTIGTTGSYTPPKSAAKFKGGGVGPSPTYSYTAAIVEVEVDPETGWIDVPRVWIAHDIGRALNPTLVRGQVEGSVYMGLGEALMEEQAFRRLPPRLSHALVHKFPSMLEYKSPTTSRHAGGLHRSDRASGSGGPVRREGSRTGAAAADHAGGRQRGLRRGRRARSTRCRSRRRRSCKALQAKAAGKPARIGTGGVSRTIAWPEPLLVAPPWEGGDGRASNEPARSRSARPTRASKPPRRCAHDAPAALPLSRAAHGGARRRRCSPSARRHDARSPAAPTCCRT